MPIEQSSPVSRRKLGIFGIVAGVVAVLVVVTGIRAREDSSARLREWTDNQAIPMVAVVLPDARALRATIDLPGRLEAYYRAPIFARVNGYLKNWSADIGARVKAGEVIAEIDAPDLDQQLLQARADLATAQANAALAKTTAARYEDLGDPVAAAIEAGFVRFRPVLMTALAMIIGMTPMALGLGEGGEQNAPLGRAVIGGLIFATVSTLFFVPVMFSIIHRRYATKPAPGANFGGIHAPA